MRIALCRYSANQLPNEIGTMKPALASIRAFQSLTGSRSEKIKNKQIHEPRRDLTFGQFRGGENEGQAVEG